MKKIMPEWGKILLSVMLGSALAMAGNIVVQERFFNQDSQNLARKEKETVYLTFLDNANAYNDAVVNWQDCLMQNAEDGCPNTVKTLMTARIDFQNSINRVYIYGSNESIDVMKRATTSLPSALSHANTGLPDPQEVLKYNGAGFSKVYSEFMTMACHELPVHSNDSCSAY